MKPVDLSFHAAASIDDALVLLSSLGEDSKIIAGGQSLGPMLNYRVARPTNLVEIRRIAALREIGRDTGSLRVGAAVSHSTIEDWNGSTSLERFLSSVAGGIAYRAIRNRGTIGGSLAHADPAADWPVVVSALNADLEIYSRERKRVVPAREFFVDQMETALAPEEVLASIRFAKGPPRRKYGYHKIARKAGEFADSIAAVCLDLEADGAASEASVWLGAALTTPCQLPEVEAILTNRPAGDWREEKIFEAVRNRLPAPESAYENYKLQLHCVAVVRALMDALKVIPK